VRKDQHAVTVVVDGVNTGIWDVLTGGEVDSDEVTYKPGAMGARISLGGSVNVGTVTLQRLFDLARDSQIIHWLIGRAGKGEAVVSKQPLDVDGNAFGRPIVYTGKLKKVQAPEADSTSTDPAQVELEVTPTGTVT
jgi:hypothetical protein